MIYNKNYLHTTNVKDDTKLSTRNLFKTSTNVRNRNLDTPLEFLLLKNWVGQINSSRELNNINFINEYSIITTKISPRILYKCISNLPTNNSSNNIN
jgi:hypothetical protein